VDRCARTNVRGFSPRRIVSSECGLFAIFSQRFLKIGFFMQNSGSILYFVLNMRQKFGGLETHPTPKLVGGEKSWFILWLLPFIKMFS